MVFLMMRGSTTSILLLLIFISFKAKAQFYDPKKATELFSNSNYTEAAPIFEGLFTKNPDNYEYALKGGICYLKANLTKSKATPLIEQYVNNNGSDNEALYYLGLAYQFDLKFDKAIASFEKYKQKAKGEGLILANKHIESCKVGKKLVAKPINVEFENLGPNINSKFPDYYPFISRDEKILAYTSRRLGNVGGMKEFDGYYSSDIWIATKDATNSFGKAKNAGTLINSSYDEQVVGMSDDGNTLYIYADKINDFGDIHYSVKEGKAYKKPEKLSEIINSPALETSASLSSDGNTLFFASDRNGGYGGLDIYMVRKLPTGEWGDPQNLGSDVNTNYNEDFPTLSPDGQTLYFSSDGHTNMGGYDIFVTIWEPEKNAWSVPKNIGYPINTPDDERVISYTEDGYHAYISANRPEGLGDLDIYKVTFLEQLPDVNFFMSLVDEQKNIIQDEDVEIEIYMANGDKFGQYKINKKTGKYLVILPKGKYSIEIFHPDFQDYIEDLEVTLDLTAQGFVHKEIILK
jgi:tetratricopeptide (TPR) repeat protein